MKTISILLSLVNSLLAGLLLTYTLSGSAIQPDTLWLLAKSVAALSIILMGVLTWLTSTNAINSGLLLIGGLYLVVLGAVTVVWTIHRAILNGDMEYYMVIFGGSLMMQGLASLLGFSEAASSMTHGKI